MQYISEVPLFLTFPTSVCVDGIAAQSSSIQNPTIILFFLLPEKESVFYGDVDSNFPMAILLIPLRENRVISEDMAAVSH